MLSIPVLAAGVVGVGLGGVVTALWFRGRPVVPLAQACARETVLRSEMRAVKGAAALCGQELSDERRAHAATKLRANTAEGHLRDLRAAAAEQEAADEPEPLPLPPGVHVFQPAPDGAPWVPNFGGPA